MAEKEENATPTEATPEPTGGALKSLKEDFAKASPKDRLKKFRVDPVTKTLRRA
ncbi:MAG: hypothetical protein V3T76_09725 [candidate division NC10 bacterium]